jgi:selenide,water dikinase
MDSLDDAGVYKLSNDMAIIETVDFFTPIVNDPYDFGQIAVANALSDIYTMGGKPITAMNIVCFPVKKMDISILQDILKGGVDKLREAGVALIGGHSIDDPEIKYGLSVTGTIHPGKMITNGGAKPGDRLILTKPLGTGIINTALKGGAVSHEIIKKVTLYMATLNRQAAELMAEYHVHACTDITGFGLIGHIYQLSCNSQVGLKIYSTSIPFFSEAREYIEHGFLPGGLKRNRDFYSQYTEFADEIPPFMNDLLFDPQTSGGLLIALDAASAESLLDKLKKAGIKDSSIIGEVLAKPAAHIFIE